MKGENPLKADRGCTPARSDKNKIKFVEIPTGKLRVKATVGMRSACKKESACENERHRIQSRTPETQQTHIKQRQQRTLPKTTKHQNSTSLPEGVVVSIKSNSEIAVMSFLGTALSYVTGYGYKHKEAKDLETNLKTIPGLIASTAERKARARYFMQSSVLTLKGDNPQSFKEAVGKGTGRFVQLLETAADAGYGSKMMTHKKFNPLANGISRSEDNNKCYLKTWYRSKKKPDGTNESVKVVEAVIFASEIPAVRRLSIVKTRSCVLSFSSSLYLHSFLFPFVDSL